MSLTHDKETGLIQCWIDLPRCQLTLSKGLGAEQRQVCFDLPATRKMDKPNLKMGEPSLGVLEAKTGAARMQPWLIDIQRYGLSLTHQACLYQETSGAPPAYFLESQNLIFPGSYTLRPAQGPYDLFVSPDLQYLAVVNRREADVLIFDLALEQLIAQHHFAPLEGDKVITVALDTDQQTVYLAGANSRQVWKWELKTDSATAFDGPWKYPTHVQLEGRRLWVLDSHKKSALHQVLLDTQEILPEIVLAGESYAHLTDTPADLMLIDSQSARLAVLTHQNLPDPLTPVLSLIDTQQAKVISKSQPAQRTWPALLVTAHANAEYQALMKKQREFLPETPPVVVKALLASFGLSLQQFKSQLLVLRAKSATPVDLPTRTREVILDLIQTQLQEQGIKLSLPPRQSEEQEVVIHAEQLAQLLRSHETLEVVIYHLMGKHTVGLKLNRQDLFAKLESAGLSMASAAEHVPETSEPEPELAYARLPAGQFTLADPLNNRLLQLNANLKVIWQLDSSLLNVYRPVDFVWLANSFLILDAESGEATCWSLSAKQEWRVSSSDNHWNQVRFLKASSPLVLGMDTNAGTLEAINTSGELQWKMAAGVIDCATAQDIWILCENAQLKQVDQNGAILNEYQLSGHPAAVAASMQKIAVFDPKAQSVEIIDIETLESTLIPIRVSSARYQIQDPTGMKWLDQNCLIYDAFRLLRVDTETQSVDASFLMQDLQLKSAKDNQAPSDMFYARVQDHTQFQGGSQQSLIEMLKKAALFNQAPELFFSEISELIRTRVYSRGEAIVNKGDEGDEMFLIRQGEVEVLGSKLTDVVARMAAGDIFGEVALMTGQKRNATVRAGGYCEVFCLKQADLDALLPHYPEVRERLILLAQTRNMQEQLRSDSERERLQQRLQDLQNQRKQSQLVASQAEQTQLARTQPAPGEVASASESTFEIWVRHSASAQLQKLSSSAQILGSIGNQHDWVQPVQAVEADGYAWVLDMGQSHLFKCDLNENKPPEALADLGLVQARDLCLDSDGHLWIADTGNAQILKLTKAGEILSRLTYGRAPVSVSAHGGELVFADLREHTVTRLNSQGEIVWQFGTPRKFGRDESLLFSPEYAQLLENGHVLITDTGNSRVLEVNQAGQIVWALLSGAGLRMMRPTRALRLYNGNTLIEHSSRSQWIEINSDLRLLWRYQVNQK